MPFHNDIKVKAKEGDTKTIPSLDHLDGFLDRKIPARAADARHTAILIPVVQRHTRDTVFHPWPSQLTLQKLPLVRCTARQAFEDELTALHIVLNRVHAVERDQPSGPAVRNGEAAGLRGAA